MNLLTLVTVGVYPFSKPYLYKPYHYQQVENCFNACPLHILSDLPVLMYSVVILFPGLLSCKLAHNYQRWHFQRLSQTFFLTLVNSFLCCFSEIWVEKHSTVTVTELVQQLFASKIKCPIHNHHDTKWWSITSQPDQVMKTSSKQATSQLNHIARQNLMMRLLY